MKKLLSVAVFSIAIMASAAEKKEVVENNTKEIKIEKAADNSLTSIMFFGCSSQGNSVYNDLVAAGMSHRDAREERRIWVRECRGNGPGGWLNLPVQF